MKLSILLLSLLLAIPLSGISHRHEIAAAKDAKAYVSYDTPYVSYDTPDASNFSFVGQDDPTNAGGQTFLSKRDPKAFNTGGRITVPHATEVISVILHDTENFIAPRPLTNSHRFVDCLLQSSISPHAP